jgi:hypothetical protein
LHRQPVSDHADPCCSSVARARNLPSMCLRPAQLQTRPSLIWAEIFMKSISWAPCAPEPQNPGRLCKTLGDLGDPGAASTGRQPRETPAPPASSGQGAYHPGGGPGAAQTRTCKGTQVFSGGRRPKSFKPSQMSGKPGRVLGKPFAGSGKTIAGVQGHSVQALCREHERPWGAQISKRGQAGRDQPGSPGQPGPPGPPGPAKFFQHLQRFPWTRKGQP